MVDTQIDRSSEDLGNIVGLEHVNVRIPDQRLASLFYVVGLGLTRDPYLTVADTNMWINVGRSQFHLPTGEPMRLRGHTGLVISDREALLGRLRRSARGAIGSAATSRTQSASGVPCSGCRTSSSTFRRAPPRASLASTA